MKSLFRYGFIFLLVFGNLKNLSAQSKRMFDSACNLLPKMKADTEKVNTLNWVANRSQDSVFVKGKIAESIALSKSLGFRKGEGNAYWVLANYYLRNQIDYVRAVRNTTECLKIRQELGDKKAVAQCYLQLALVDSRFENFEKAIPLIRKARAINVEIENQKGINSDDQAMAQIYQASERWDSAVYYYQKTLQSPNPNQATVAIAYINLVSVFIGMNKFDTAELYIHKCDSVYGLLKNDYGPKWNRMNLGQIYLLRGEKQKAVSILEPCYQEAESTQNADFLLNVLPILIDAYRQVGDSEKGFKVQTEWIKLNDSLKDVDKANSILGEQIRYEEDEQAKIDALIKLKEKSENDAKAERQQIVIYSVTGILLVVLVMSLFVYRGYRQKKKANEIISHQKSLVEEKQKEVMDSIHYAKRIQQSLLPNEKYIEKSLKKQKDNKA